MHLLPKSPARVLSSSTRVTVIRRVGLSTLLASAMLCPAQAHADAADALLLSDAQMQKLHAYFPAEDESVPLVYRGDPVAIRLPVGVEKRVMFSESIEANLNGSLSSDQLRVINNDQSLYLTALKPFASTRIFVTLKQSHKILLLDLATADDATNVTRSVKLSTNNPSNTNSASAPVAASASPASAAPASMTTSPAVVDEGASPASADSYVKAIRFAWQQLYAPQRLLSNDNGFTRTPLRTQPFISTLVYGDKVFAHPEISWLANGVYVTAVQLRNKYSHATHLNLQRDLCGDWQAATLYPRSHLKSAGDKTGDSTTLFLISNQPFAKAMEVCHGGA